MCLRTRSMLATLTLRQACAYPTPTQNIGSNSRYSPPPYREVCRADPPPHTHTHTHTHSHRVCYADWAWHLPSNPQQHLLSEARSANGPIGCGGGGLGVALHGEEVSPVRSRAAPPPPHICSTIASSGPRSITISSLCDFISVTIRVPVIVVTWADFY